MTIKDSRIIREVSCFDRIWEAGNVFDEAQRVGLIETLTSLSSVSDISSSGLLIDPYRHAMIFSRTRKRSGVVVAPPVTNDYAISTRFAALLSDFLPEYRARAQTKGAGSGSDVATLQKLLDSLDQQATKKEK